MDVCDTIHLLIGRSLTPSQENVHVRRHRPRGTHDPAAAVQPRQESAKRGASENALRSLAGYRP